MFPAPTFYILLTLCWIYALLRGGKAERAGTAIMIVGSALTIVFDTEAPHRFQSLDVGMMAVDLAAFAAFAVLALRADRFWPIWVSAFAGLGFLGHLARWYAGPDVVPHAYAVALKIWSYPILATLVIGTLNHRRRIARESPTTLPAAITPSAKA